MSLKGSGCSGNQGELDGEDHDEVEDLLDDVDEADPSNYVSSSNDPDQADGVDDDDDVDDEDDGNPGYRGHHRDQGSVSCSENWRQDVEDEPLNLRGMGWQSEPSKTRSRLGNAESVSYFAAKMSEDWDDDNGGVVTGNGAAVAAVDGDDLVPVFANFVMNARASSVPPPSKYTGGFGQISNRSSSQHGVTSGGSQLMQVTSGSAPSQPFISQGISQSQNPGQRNTYQNQSLSSSHNHQQHLQQQPHHQQQQQHSRNLSPQRNRDVSLGFYNWQSTKMTVKERLAFLFNNSILSDVTFVVGRDNLQQRIPAHRFVLSVGSAVFDAMFNSTWPTNNEEIPLPDVEPASFLALLKFLYSDEVQICPETVMTTLYTAKKYAVPALERHCVEYLKRHLCADNAFLLLTQARLFDEPQLAAMCLETIDKSTPEALSAEGFLDIDVDTLSSVLDRDSLRIKEAKLFTHVIRWSEAECLRQGLPVSSDNKRSVLGPVLSKIRFPVMNVEEFAQGPAQSGILTDREVVSLFLHFTVNPKPPVAFLDVPRTSMTGKEQTVCRFQQIESRWGYSGTADKIRFMVDRKIFIVGFGLYGSIHGPSEYQVNIQILQTGSGRVLGSNENSFLSDGTNATFRVMFKEPIELQANTNYTACATLKGLDSHYGTKGLRKVVIDCPNGGKVSFQFSYAAGNNNGTSVEDGQIPEIIFYT